MKHLILALLVATLSLPVMAATTVKSSKSNSSEREQTPAVEGSVVATNLNSSRSNVERGKPSKEQISDQERAPSGADSCNFTIDQKGVKRQATAAQQKACKTANESRSNSLRGGNPSSGNPNAGAAGIAVSDPGVPADKGTSKK
jgi:hypothetical protein